MSTFQKFQTFEFKTSNDNIKKLIDLNNPYFGTKIQIITSYSTKFKWIYVVGVYNDEYETNLMNKKFEENLKKLDIKYNKYCSLGVYGFTDIGDDTMLQYLIRRIMILFTTNNVKVISYTLVDGNPLVDVRKKPYPIIRLYDTIPVSKRILGVMLLYRVNKIKKAQKLLASNNINDLTNNTIESEKMKLFSTKIQTLLTEYAAKTQTPDQVANNELLDTIRGIIVQIASPNQTTPSPL
jgi:hypothetical protein